MKFFFGNTRLNEQEQESAYLEFDPKVFSDGKRVFEVSFSDGRGSRFHAEVGKYVQFIGNNWEKPKDFISNELVLAIYRAKPANFLLLLSPPNSISPNQHVRKWFFDPRLTSGTIYFDPN